MLQTPVLFLIYNRADLTARTFARIRQAQPAQLFIAGDGAKNAEDALKVAQTRQIIDAIDWACEVKTLFREENLGCGKAISEALTWFFRQVEFGIIIEDDCLVESSFFPFCEELLQRYADNPQVMVISAMSFLPTHAGKQGESYYFSQFSQIWGWASWRRAWQYLDFEMKGWDEFVQTNQIKRIAPLSRQEQTFWLAYLQAYKDRNPNLWATRWWFSVWQARGIVVAPYANLVSNIGFGENSTNTKNTESWFANLPTSPVRFPLQHPKELKILHTADHHTYRVFFNPREKWLKSIKNWLSQYLPLSLRLILKKIFPRG